MDYEKKTPSAEDEANALGDSESLNESELVNASGHVQELDRKFGIWSVCLFGLLCDYAWAAGGGALVVALYNGGGPGVLYGLIASTFFYCLIGASLAELSSAIPSSANVYHWASVTSGPRFGRVCSWFAGWWNCFSWIFGTCTGCLFAANTIMAMYTIYHPDFQPERWQIFIAYLGVCWLTSALVLFGQSVLSKVAASLGLLCLACFFVLVIACAIMPSQTGYGYASSHFVWGDFQNLTGWSSNGFVFLAGMLNGAYAIGTPDAVCHLCEEVPNPRKNVPKAILVQLTTGFITSFVFYIVMLYGTTSLDDVFNSPIQSLPLAAMIQQCVRSDAATFGLLFVFLIDVLIGIPGAWITASRIMWTLGRDDATPFSSWVGAVSPRWRNPFNALLLCTVIASALGAIYVGNAQAFNSFVGAFTIFTTLSYITAILPHLLNGRKYVKPGPFWMPKWVAYPVMAAASAYTIVFNVIYMFPYTYPVSVDNMNWECVITGGITILMVFGYLIKRRCGYRGPHVVQDAHDDIMKGMIGMDKVLEGRRR